MVEFLMLVFFLGFIFAMLVSNPVAIEMKGEFDRVVHDLGIPKQPRTIVHFKDGKVCRLKGEHNIPFAPGAAISVIQREKGNVEVKEIGMQEEAVDAA